MNEEFVSEKTAQLAKSANFNEKCLFIYNNGELYQINNIGYTKSNSMCNSELNKYSNSVSAPTQTQLSKWLRTEHNVHVVPILSTCNNIGKGVYKCNIIFPDDNGTALSTSSLIYYAYKETVADKYCINIGTYEEALEAGLQMALETLINLLKI